MQCYSNYQKSGITGVVLHPIMAMFSLSCNFSARDSGEAETDFVDRFIFFCCYVWVGIEGLFDCNTN